MQVRHPTPRRVEFVGAGQGGRSFHLKTRRQSIEDDVYKSTLYFNQQCVGRGTAQSREEGTKI